MTRIAILLSLVAAILANAALADTVAITNARIYTMGKAGDVQGTVLIHNGWVSQVGPRVGVPANATVIDAKGGAVTPGFFIVATNLGAVEVELVKETNDTATKNSSLSAAFNIAYGIDANSVVIPVARLGGVTRALVTPGYPNGADDRELLFAGQAAIITLAQGANPVTRSHVAQVLELGEGGAERSGGARGSAISALRADLDDVRWYARRRGAYNVGSARDLRFSKADLDALVPVVQGRMKLIVGAHRAADIREVLKLAREYRLKIVLSGAEEGWMVADEIARARVPVLLNPTQNLPSSFEARGSTMENAARLHAAGVTIAIANGDGGHRARESRYNAGNAVAHGLPHNAALAALTLNPARIFGETKLGSIERGKQADIVVWTGDPLEPSSQPIAILIKGVQQPLDSRAEDLAKRYRDLGTPYPPAYRD